MKKIVKIILDVVITSVFILLMNTNITGMKLHEIVGLAILFAIIVHNILNFKWIKSVTINIFSKNITAKTRIMYILDMLLLILTFADVLIGVAISKCILTNITFGNIQTLTMWHKFVSYWLLIIISIHIGLHWDQVIIGVKNILKKLKIEIKDSIAVKIILKIVYIAIAIAGIISLAKPGVNKNFILQSEKNNKGTENPFQGNKNTSQGSSSNFGTQSQDEDLSEDEQEDKKNTTGLSTISSVTVEEVTSLQDYLGKLYCTGCGKHCPLTNPQCGKGMSRQTEEVENYNEMYGTNESYSSSSSSSSSNSSSAGNNNSSSSSNSNSSFPTQKGEGKSRPSESAESGNGSTNMQFNNREQDSNNKNSEANLMDYVWIMGFVIGGTYYVAKLSSTNKNKKS